MRYDTIIALSFGWDILPKVLQTGIGRVHEISQNTNHGNVGVALVVSGSHSKHTCMHTHVGPYLSDLRCVVIGHYAMGRSLMDRSITP